jgi:Rieske Fe-S protein
VNRKKLRGGAWRLVKENLDFPYYLVRDRLSARRTVTLFRAPKRGEGRVQMIDGKQAACSRDSQGKVHRVSAVCTHLGCLVHWNDAELTWDCPCHGSRFHPDGRVLAGPAETPLEPIDQTSEEQPARHKPSGKNGKPRQRRSAAAKKGRQASGRR